MFQVILNFAARRLKVLVLVVTCNKFGDYSTFCCLICSRLEELLQSLNKYSFKNWF